MPRGKPINGYPKNRKSRSTTDETRQRISAALRGRRLSSEHRAAVVAYWTPERRQAQSEVRRGLKWNREPAIGSCIDKDGYCILTMQQGHPLARSSGRLEEHRKVLYDAVGPEDPLCHWCGKQLRWVGPRDVVVCVDHLDEDRLNNDLGNLVPSCSRDNWNRNNPKMRNHLP